MLYSDEHSISSRRGSRLMGIVDTSEQVMADWPVALGQRDAMIAWAAGFFDGEGCVRLQVQYMKRLKNPTIGLSVAVTNSDRRPIDLFQRAFPAGKRHIQRHWINGRLTPYSEWFAWGKVAYEFCKVILPFSVVKRDQLELAIQFSELPWRPQSRGAKGWPIARTAEQVASDLDFAARVKGLKLVYREPSVEEQR